jgi:hypothetical protein
MYKALIMKKLFLYFLFGIIHFTLMAQSPQLTIKAVMDSVKAESIRYKIEMKICEPNKITERGGNIFSRDTSAIDFTSLKTNDIKCGKYSDNEMPTLISGEEEKKINQFKFSNQVFGWEKILVLKISNSSSRGWWPEMYIVMPIKYKSFRTTIDITDIEFLSGKVVFLTEVNASYDESKLNIRKSLKNAKAVEVKGFPLQDLLEKK